MKSILTAIILGVFVIKTKAEWHKVWEDDFNGSAVNTSNWYLKDTCQVYSHELECYTSRPENVRVNNGSLVIHVNVEEYKDKNFTSGFVSSKQGWTYGKFEIRAKLPKGRHLWTVFSMVPAKPIYGDWAANGMIKVAESVGERTDEILSSLAYGGNSPNYVTHSSGRQKFGTTDFSADFHIFAVEWDAKEIKFTSDGKEYYKEDIDKSLWSGKGINPYTKNGQPFDQPFLINLDVAVDGDMFPTQWFGPHITPEEAKKWEQPTMVIDYVRVYQSK